MPIPTTYLLTLPCKTKAQLGRVITFHNLENPLVGSLLNIKYQIFLGILHSQPCRRTASSSFWPRCIDTHMMSRWTWTIHTLSDFSLWPAVSTGRQRNTTQKEGLERERRGGERRGGRDCQTGSQKTREVLIQLLLLTSSVILETVSGPLGFVLFLSLFYWSIVDLQSCVSFYCAAKWFISFLIFFSIMVYHRILNIVPRAIW